MGTCAASTLTSRPGDAPPKHPPWSQQMADRSRCGTTRPGATRAATPAHSQPLSRPRAHPSSRSCDLQVTIKRRRSLPRSLQIHWNGLRHNDRTAAKSASASHLDATWPRGTSMWANAAQWGRRLSSTPRQGDSGSSPNLLSIVHHFPGIGGGSPENPWRSEGGLVPKDVLWSRQAQSLDRTATPMNGHESREQGA